MKHVRQEPGSSAGRAIARRRIGSGPRPRVPGSLAYILGCLLLVSSAGCLFSTRTPEPPIVNNVPWVDPIAPERVLTNVKVTLEARSVGNYDRSLSVDFTFIPSDGDRAFAGASGDPTYYDSPPWTKQREVDAITAIFQQSKGAVAFTWGPPIPTLDEMLTDQADTGGGRFYQNLKYKMVFIGTGADTTVSGLVDLYLRDSTGGWSIYKWVDLQDGSGNPTLGLLRRTPNVWGTAKGPGGGDGHSRRAGPSIKAIG